MLASQASFFNWRILPAFFRSLLSELVFANNKEHLAVIGSTKLHTLSGPGHARIIFSMLLIIAHARTTKNNIYVPRGACKKVEHLLLEAERRRLEIREQLVLSSAHTYHNRYLLCAAVAAAVDRKKSRELVMLRIMSRARSRLRAGHLKFELCLTKAKINCKLPCFQITAIAAVDLFASCLIFWSRGNAKFSKLKTILGVGFT